MYYLPCRTIQNIEVKIKMERYSFVEWFTVLKKETVRKQNLLREPNNPMYWSRHGETDFHKWARPSCDNVYIAENKLN